MTWRAKFAFYDLARAESTPHLFEQFGERYRRYRDEVGMLLPRPAKISETLAVVHPPRSTR